MVAIQRRYFFKSMEAQRMQTPKFLVCWSVSLLNIVAKKFCTVDFQLDTHTKISVMHCLFLYNLNLTIASVQMFRCCFCSGLEMDAEEQGYQYTSLL